MVQLNPHRSKLRNYCKVRVGPKGVYGAELTLNNNDAKKQRHSMFSNQHGNY